jgi:hypothetical protein
VVYYVLYILVRVTLHTTLVVIYVCYIDTRSRYGIGPLHGIIGPLQRLQVPELRRYSTECRDVPEYPPKLLLRNLGRTRTSHITNRTGFIYSMLLDSRSRYGIGPLQRVQVPELRMYSTESRDV